VKAKQRAQVVELLRCAHANRSSINGAANLIEAASDGEREIPACDVVAAIRARDAAWIDEPAGEYWNVGLRAALRVEEGWKP
jgi:hypothetical protein